MTDSVDLAASERAENIRMIRESAGFAVEPGRLDRVRRARYDVPGYDLDDWKQVVELGLLGLRLPESRGGANFGMAEFCALAEELGKGLLPETIVHATAIAPLLPDVALEGLMAGTRIILPAVQERLGDPAPVSATSAGGKVSGVKRFIPYAASATDYLVSTVDGAMLVEKDAAGVSLTIDALQDGGHFGTLTLDGAAGTAVDGAFDDAREEIVLGLSAYLLGMAEQTFEITRQYLMTREQFGKPIGSFQALQHRMVDMYYLIAITRASVGKAASLLDAGATGDQRKIATSRAKARASDSIALITREAVQFHGGMGYTDDCDVGLYLRKAMVLCNAYGSSGWHRHRFATLSDLRNNRIAA